MKKIFFIVVTVFVTSCNQFVMLMTFENKCEEVSKKLLHAIMLNHTEKFGNSLVKKDYGVLNHNNVGGNCCAVAFIDDELHDTYLEYNMLPKALKRVSNEKNLQGINVAVFNSGGNNITSGIFAMFDIHYRQLFPFQGMQITPPQGRHVDAEEQLLLALDDRSIRTHLKSKKWRTMIIVTSMDTCKYCAISISGFLSLNQRLAFANDDLAYRLKSVRIYYPFSYDDPTMKLNLTRDSHILLLPPHVEHIQFDRQQSIDIIAESVQTTNNIVLLSALCKQIDKVFELKPDFLMYCWNTKKSVEKDKLFSCIKFQEALSNFLAKDRKIEFFVHGAEDINLVKLIIKEYFNSNIYNNENFLIFAQNICKIIVSPDNYKCIKDFIFQEINKDLNIIELKQDILVKILGSFGQLTTRDIPDEYRNKGEMIRRIRNIGINIKRE